MNVFRNKSLLICISLFLAFFVCANVSAKKKKKSKKFVNPRIQNMSQEDQELFDQLTSKQKKNISKGKVEVGYNAWMVKKALGDPYYNTEHHPKYTDYEQVWLYTKNEVEESITENKIHDPVNNLSLIHI